MTSISAYKVNEGIGSLLVEVDLAQLSIFGKDTLQLLIGNVAGQVPHKETTAGIELLLCSVQGRQVKLWPTQLIVDSLLDLVLQWEGSLISARPVTLADSIV